jgi:hypothetical protein
MRRTWIRPRVRVAGGMALLFVLYGILFAVQQEKEKRATRLSDVTAGTVTGVRLAFSQETAAELKRENGRFLFVEPYAGVLAEPRAIDQYLAVVQRLPVRRRWALADDPSPYGIGPESPRLVLITPFHERVYVLGNRNPVAPEFYVYLPHTHEIALIPAPAVAVFQARAIDFRNRRVFPADGTVTGWTVQGVGRPLVQGEKRGEEWWAAEEDGPFVPCDRRQAMTLVDRINGVRLTDFDALDKKRSLAEAGLLAPPTRLTVLFSTGPAVDLVFSNSSADSRSLTVAVNGEIVGGVPPSFVDGLPRGRADIERKNLIDFPLQAIGRFTVVRDGTTAVYEKERGKWVRLGRERRPVDLRAVQSFFLKLAKIKIEKFEFGETVEAVDREYAFFKADGESLLVLRLGVESFGQVPASFPEAPYRFTIPSSDLDQLGI